MIGTAQGAQGRSRAARSWLAALALGAIVGFGVSPAFAGPAADAPGIAKKHAVGAAIAIVDKAKKDDTAEKAGLSLKAGDEKAKKDEALEKDAVSHPKAGSTKEPDSKDDERKKP
jgi:hypothetical protein